MDDDDDYGRRLPGSPCCDALTPYEEDEAEGLANDAEVEEFAEFASREALRSTCVVATLLAWSHSKVPTGVLTPECFESELSDGLLNERALTQALLRVENVLIPCILEYQEELIQAKRIVAQIQRRSSQVCVIAVLLLPKPVLLTRDTNEVLLRRHSELLASGVDDVIFEPQRDVAVLKRAINLTRAMWQTNMLRAKLMLNVEVDFDCAEEASQVQAEHAALLWEQIPKTLMPEFRPVNDQILETTNTVGNFRLISRLPSHTGTVLQAVDVYQKAIAIKVVEKSQTQDPGLLESIYREFRFMGEVVRHPNIAKCLDMLHSPSRIYLVMEFAGSGNIESIIAGREEPRMNESEVNNCFEQVVRGIAYLHAQNIAHRNICLRHLVISTLAGSDREHVRIVDFQSAMLVRADMTSRTVIGAMPYMPPEMALGGPYWPHSADAWSCGIALLEMAGGLGSLAAAVNVDMEAPPASIAPVLLQFFEDPVSHADALAAISRVDTITVIEQLEQLLVPNRADRVLLKNLLPENAPGADAEMLHLEQQRLQQEQQQQQQQQQQMLQLMQAQGVPEMVYGRQLVQDVP